MQLRLELKNETANESVLSRPSRTSVRCDSQCPKLDSNRMWLCIRWPPALESTKPKPREFQRDNLDEARWRMHTAPSATGGGLSSSSGVSTPALRSALRTTRIRSTRLRAATRGSAARCSVSAAGDSLSTALRAALRAACDSLPAPRPDRSLHQLRPPGPGARGFYSNRERCPNALPHRDQQTIISSRCASCDCDCAGPTSCGKGTGDGF